MRHNTRSKKNKKIILSAFVVVRNEEKKIAKVMESLDFCDEIILVDQESTDDTVKIARKYTDKVLIDKIWGCPEPSRKLASEKCRGKWIFNIDADEDVPPALKKEILKVIKTDEYDIYRILRRFFYLGKYLKHLGQDDYVLRLHKKGEVIYTSQLHNGVFPRKGAKIKTLDVFMNHYPFDTVAQHRDRIMRYSAVIAKNNKKYNAFPGKYFGIFYRPIVYFFYYYIYKRGFLDGRQGFIWSVMGSYHELMVFKNVWFPKNIEQRIAGDK